MRDPARIHRICQLLETAWCRFPDWRFFQLISNLSRHVKRDIFFIEDDEAEKMFQDFLDNMS